MDQHDRQAWEDAKRDSELAGLAQRSEPAGWSATALAVVLAMMGIAALYTWPRAEPQVAYVRLSHVVEE